MRLPDSVRRLMVYLLEEDAKARGESKAPPETAEVKTKIQLPDALQGWLDEAVSQMGWKRARPCAEKELAAHLSDQYAECKASGMDETAAAKATLREMGDPIETGTRLDRAWRPRPDWITLCLTLLLSGVGVIIQSLIYARSDNVLDLGEPVHQLATFAIGAIVLFAAYLFDYTALGRYAKYIFIIWAGGCLVLSTLSIMGMVPYINGQLVRLRQMIGFFPLVFSGVLYAQRGKGVKGIVKCLAAIAFMGVMCFIVPSTGLVCVTTFACCTVLAAAVWRGVFGARSTGKLVLAFSPVLFGAALFICMFNLFYERLDLILHLDSVRGYFMAQLQHIMFGRTLPSDLEVDAARFARNCIEPTDFVLTGLKYNFGWGSVVVVMLALGLLLWRGLRICKRQSGLLAWCVSLTAVVTLGAQSLSYFIANCGIMVCSFPGLPLFSYGIVFHIQTMLLIGMLLSAQRMGGIETNAKIPIVD